MQCGGGGGPFLLTDQKEEWSGGAHWDRESQPRVSEEQESGRGRRQRSERAVSQGEVSVSTSLSNCVNISPQ